MKKAFDAVATLKSLKPVVAATGDKQAIDSFNMALRAARGEDSGDGVSAFRMLQDALRTPDTIDPLQDRIQTAQAFEDMCKRFHRKNPQDVLKEE